MRGCIVRDGVVESIVDLPGLSVDPDGSAARGPATSTVVDEAGGVGDVEAYETVFRAPAGAEIVASTTANVGWVVVDGRLEPPARPPEEVAAERERDARAECGRRIVAAIPATTQANLSAYAAVIGLKPAASRTPAEDADAAAYAAGVAWIAGMRARWRAISREGLDPFDETAWPALPDAAARLVARF